MALSQLKPVYREWVSKITPETIQNDALALSQKFDDVINDILRSDMKDAEIEPHIDDIRKRLLYLNLAYSSMKQSNPTVDKILDKLSHTMTFIDNYEKRNVSVHQKKSLSMIALISIIVLPLTLITSYFGMNFASMGAPAKKSGVLAVKYGEALVFVLGIISIIIAVWVLNNYYTITM